MVRYIAAFEYQMFLKEAVLIGCLPTSLGWLSIEDMISLHRYKLNWILMAPICGSFEIIQILAPLARLTRTRETTEGSLLADFLS